MAAPTRLLPERLFRPTGNSPPVNLAQYLAREKPAKLLSLGCGDIRNILFTAYCEADSGRHVDITCCDVEKAVIARNIFLLTLLIDEDPTNTNNELLFKLAFDMVLDEEAFALFRKHGKKLRIRAKSIEKWHNCMYGKVIRFGDRESLQQVADVWECYSWTVSSDISRFDQVKQRSQRIGKPGVSVEMAEAFAPFNVCLKNELLDFHENYWKTGMVDYDTETEGKKLYWNPTYSFRGDWLILHPGTCPLEGFNLALGFAPLGKSSPLAGEDNETKSIDRSIESMKIQFRAWTAAFGRMYRKANIVLRFVIGDALAFCHTLAARQSNFPILNGLPRGPMSLKPMNLDGPDYLYFQPGSEHQFFHAPLIFNSIDTSSLTNRCGTINTLLAAESITHGSMETTVVTEISLHEMEGAPGVIEPSIQGNFFNMMMLIGLSPVEFFANNTSTPTDNKNFLLTIQKRLGKKDPVVKMRICWRPCGRAGQMPIDGQCIFRGMQYPPRQLGALFYRIYNTMFREGKKKTGALQRTPATFAALLKRIKQHETDRWPVVMASLMNHFHTDPDNELADVEDDDEGSRVADQEFSEMLAQLERFEAYDLADSLPLLGQPATKKAYPSYVTLLVPRCDLGCLVKKTVEPARLGSTLSVTCTVKVPGEVAQKFSIFSMTFGWVRISQKWFGKRDWQLEVIEDQRHWAGELSALLVTFVVPPSLLTDPEVTVSFGFDKTPQALEMFQQDLGPELTLFETRLDVDGYLFVCNEAPVLYTPPPTSDEANGRETKSSDNAQPTSQNKPGPKNQSSVSAPDSVVAVLNQIFQNGPPAAPPADTERADSVISFDSDEIEAQINSSVNLVIEPGLSESTSDLTMITATITFHGGDWKNGLRNGTNYTMARLHPCFLRFEMKGVSSSINFSFPFPVGTSIVVATDPDEGTISVQMMPFHPAGEKYPMMQSSFIWMDHINTMGVAYLPLDHLPAFDRAQLRECDEFRNLIAHMQSEREAELERYPDMKAGKRPEEKQIRSNFKDGLKFLFRDFCGFDVKPGEKPCLFLFNALGAGDQFLLYVSAMRLDIGNQSYVLDAAVIPMTKANRLRVRQMFNKVSNANAVNYAMGASEIAAWKWLLTTGVERARTWRHKATCEYKTVCKMPASIETYVNFLCTCGNGQLPDGFFKKPPPGWDKLKDQAIRVAISPCYSSMLAEPQIPPRMTPKFWGPPDLGKEDYVPQCFECGKEQGDDKLTWCGRCSTATYCSRECQAKNFKTHKESCGHYAVVRRGMK
ncbi:hypothetical protein HDK77DRAFT_477037 [Phyllosticta capitalensis]